MDFIHVADIIQHAFHPCTVAIFLISAVARGGRCEGGDSLVADADETALTQVKERVALDGLHHGQRIPHPLPWVVIVVHQIDLLDGMAVSP